MTEPIVLLPCPFCQQPGYTTVVENDHYPYHDEVHVDCTSCSASTRSVEDWNERRVPYRRQSLTLELEDGKPVGHFQRDDEEGPWIHISDITGNVP